MADLFTPNLARIYAKSHGPSVLMSQRRCSAHFSRVYANFRRFMLHLVFFSLNLVICRRHFSVDLSAAKSAAMLIFTLFACLMLQMQLKQ